MHPDIPIIAIAKLPACHRHRYKSEQEVELAEHTVRLDSAEIVDDEISPVWAERVYEVE